MNQGIFGFPSALGGVVLSTTQIDVSGSYRIAPGTKRLIIYAVGAGGGGGAGDKRASGAHSGGASGSGGSQLIQDFNVADLGGVNTTLSIAIGAGGLAGAVQGDQIDGLAGGAGGITTITPTGKLGTLIHCPGGLGGSGGSTSTSVAGAARQGFFYGVSTSHLIGGGCSASTGTPANTGGSAMSSINAHAGCAGAGLIASSPAAIAGGAPYFSVGSGNSSVGHIDYARSYNIVGASSNTVAIVNPNIHICGKMSPGVGGHGGGSGLTGATRGADGWRGSGAGGGGSTVNGYTSGAGGTGGNGYVCIVALE